jgi:hypothetical protein
VNWSGVAERKRMAFGSPPGPIRLTPVPEVRQLCSATETQARAAEGSRAPHDSHTGPLYMKVEACD